MGRRTGSEPTTCRFISGKKTLTSDVPDVVTDFAGSPEINTQW
jgi:hypothetical protein